MPYITDKLASREADITTLLKTHLSNFQALLTAHQNSESEYLANNPGTRDQHQINEDIKLIERIREETELFFSFLHDSSDLPSENAYVQAYEQAWDTATTFTTFSPIQAMFHLYQTRMRLNTMNLDLSLLRVEAYPRNPLEYITDTIRSILHYLDKLITMICNNKQTMRETYTPGASFLGKKHFIEPSTRVGLQEKIRQLFEDGQSSLNAQLQRVVMGN